MPYVAAGFVPEDARVTRITIASYDKKTPVGTLHNICYDGEIAFVGLVDLLLTLDQMLDELDLPKASTNTRSFIRKPELLKQERVSRPDAPLATFNLKILFRQNASWQGTVLWLEGQREAGFRSVLELITLFDSTLADTFSRT